MFSKITTAWKLTLSLVVVSCLTALTPVPIASAGSVAPTRDECGLVKRTDGTFEIANEAELAIFGVGTCGLASRYILTADIAWNKAWQGPATSIAPFTGSFDGDGHSISGLAISGVEASFITFTNGATIRNLSFGAVVTGGLGAAAVVSSARSSSILNVQVSGSISGTGPDHQCLGGLIGESWATTIKNSSFKGNIKATSDNGWYVGGLIGCAYWDSVVKESYFQGSINAYASVGGLVGYLLHSDVINSYAVGTVSGQIDSVGGLVGWNDGRGNPLAVKNSYASVRLTGGSTIASLVGYGGDENFPLTANNTSITASFWEAGLSGTVEPKPIGNLSDADLPLQNLTVLSAAQLNDFSIYDDANWDVQNVWGTCEEVARPFLLWQYESTPCHSWWVAASGTAAQPASSGSSCANPSFVGNTQVAIQTAIDSAAQGTTIRICDGNYSIRDTLVIDEVLTIEGFGELLPVLDGNNTTRIMSINGAAIVNLNGLQFRNGRVIGDANPGAAIQVHTTTNLTVVDSVFLNNVAEWHGGAVGMVETGGIGILNVARSTFYNNHAEDGGAIATAGGNVTSVRDSTFVSNKATRSGGALSNSHSYVTASHSTFVDNVAYELGSTLYEVSSNGNIIANSPSATAKNAVCHNGPDSTNVTANNVTNDSTCGTASLYEEMELGFLGMWGGRTPTVRIGATSNARNAMPEDECAGIDQHKMSRTVSCDVGAVEFQTNQPTALPTPPDIRLAVQSGFESTNLADATLQQPVTYRLATEVSKPLPGGVTLSSSGLLEGTPQSTYPDDYFVITATLDNGQITSGLVKVDNCVLSRSTSGASLEITNKNDLEIFRIDACGMAQDYIQTKDVAWDGPWDGPASWDSPFTGKYDGGNHSVTGLQISGERTSFISHTEGAVISNLLFDATVNGSYGSAGLVRNAVNTSILNVHGSGSVTVAQRKSQGCNGGLAGEMSETTVRNSSYIGTIHTPFGLWIGGLIGCAYTGSKLENSYFQGSVTGIDSLGGLIGLMDYAEISNSYAIGSVTGSAVDPDYGGVGGLVGNLNFDSSDDDVVAVEKSYAQTQIAGIGQVGALIGKGQSTSISSAFWHERLTELTGLNAIGQLTDEEGVQPDLTTTSAEQMKNLLFFKEAGWDIGNGLADATERSTVWAMCDEEERPFLFWQYSNTKCEQPTTPVPENDTPPADTPISPSGDPGPTTNTTSPSTTTPTTPTTVVSVPASTSERVASTLNTAPKLATGAMAIFSAGKRMDNALKWSGNSTISGMIGGVKFTAKFNQGVTQVNTPATVKAGSTFVLSLQGLKPGSKVVATLFSLPTTLGEFVAASNGKVEAVVRVPASVLPGSHRLRVELVDQNDKEIAVWSGIRVTSDIMLLPATGSSSLPTIFIALWILIAGLTLAVRKRFIF